MRRAQRRKKKPTAPARFSASSSVDEAAFRARRSVCFHVSSFNVLCAAEEMRAGGGAASGFPSAPANACTESMNR